MMTKITDMDASQFLKIGVIGITLGKLVITNFIDSTKTAFSNQSNGFKNIQNVASQQMIRVVDVLRQDMRNRWNNNGDGITIVDPDSIRQARQVLESMGVQTRNITDVNAQLLLDYQQQQRELQTNRDLQSSMNAEIQEMQRQIEAAGDAQDEATEALRRQKELREEDLRNLNAQIQRQQQLNSQTRLNLRTNTGIVDPDSVSIVPAQTTENENTGINNRNPSGRGNLRGQMFGAAGAMISQGLLSAVATGLTTAVATGDAGSALEIAGVAFLTTVAPILFDSIQGLFTNLLSERFLPWLGDQLVNLVARLGAPLVAGFGAIIAAIIAGIVAAVVISKKIEKASKAAEKAEMNRLRNVEEKNKELTEQAQQSSSKRKETTNKKDTLTSSVERYEELQKKGFRNSKEQEEFESLYETLTTDYSEVIDSQDENTKQLKINSQAVIKLTDSYNTEIEENRKQAIADNNQIIRNNIDAYNKIRIPIDNMLQERSLINFNEESSNDMSKMAESLLYDDLKAGFSAVGENVVGEVLPDLDLEEFNKTKSLDDFKSALKEANLTFDEFREKLDEATKDIANYDTLNQQAQDAAKSAYKNMEIDGQEMSDELADMLSKTVDIKDMQVGAIESYTNGGNKEWLREIRDSKNWGGVKLLQNEEQNADLLKELQARKVDVKKLFSGKHTTNAAKWEDLDADVREYALNQGYDKAIWEDMRKSSEDYRAFLNNYFSQVYKDSLQEVEASLGKENIEKYSAELNRLAELSNDMMDYTNTELDERLKEIEEDKLNLYKGIFSDDALSDLDGAGINTESIRTAIEKGSIEDIEDFINELSESDLKDGDLIQEITAAKEIYEVGNEKLDEQKQEIQESIDALLGEEKELAQNLTFGTKQEIIDAVGSVNLTSAQSSQMATVMTKTVNSVGEEAMTILNSIPFDQSYGTIMTGADEYIQAIAATGKNINEATQIFNEYVKEVYDIIGRIGFGSESAEITTDAIFGQIKGYRENYDILSQAQKEFLEDGKLSEETYWKLWEEGFEDFIDITDKGYTLLAEKSEKFLVDSAMAPYNELLNDIDEQKTKLQELDSIVSDEGIKTNWNTQLKRYNDETDLEKKEEIKKEVLSDTWENSLGKNRNILVQMMEAGITSVDEGKIKGKENLLGLTKVQPDVYIGSLESIASQYEQVNEKVQDLQDELTDLNDELEDNKNAIDDAKDSIKDAEEALFDANEQLAEANQQLQEAIHGTDNFASSLDGLINYTTKLKNIDNAIEDIKSSLEEVNDINEAQDLFGSLNSNYDSKIANLGAQNRVINDAMANLRNTLVSNYGQYISFDSSGSAQLDFAYMQMDANDELKKAFEEEYNLYEEYRDKQIENDKAIKEIEKERKEYRKQVLDDYVSLQEKVIDLLKEKSQEEIDITKEKYDAMAEADSDYLDALEEAINKQRELRDQESEWNDLATKEKRLSLMQRDTSGANAKEVANLEKEIENDREKLLDESIDNVVDNLKELYEEQKEARELEIEYMEEVTENAQYFNEWAQSIMASWTSSTDLVGWFTENNPEIKDMTVEQTEQYMQELERDYSAYATYAALLKTDMTTNAQAVANEIDFLYNNVSENISNIGTVTQETAQKAADDSVAAANDAVDAAHEAIAAAQEQMVQAQLSYQDAVDKMNETQKKINETADVLVKAEEDAEKVHKNTIEVMTEATKSGMLEVETYAYGALLDLYSSEITDITQFYIDKGWTNAQGITSAAAKDAATERGYDTSGMTDYKYELWFDPTGPAPSQLIGTYDNQQDANNAINSKKDLYSQGLLDVIPRRYATGGLVNYTGPAWVDGTEKRPEAFLNASDTARIGEAARLLAESPIFNSTGQLGNVSTKVGDTSFEININVENISEDYSVDQMIARVRQDILDVSQTIGTPVILSK